jgi:hypothetical protein
VVLQEDWFSFWMCGDGVSIGEGLTIDGEADVGADLLSRLSIAVVW